MKSKNKTRSSWENVRSRFLSCSKLVSRIPDSERRVNYAFQTRSSLHSDVLEAKMDRWLNKVAVVTGASSGIGAAIAKALVEKGVKVVGLARRVHKMEALQKSCENHAGNFHPIRCDLSDENDITKSFEWAIKNLGGVDILVNNAGIAIRESILGGSTESYRKILDINTVAVAICTKKAVESMKERKTPGHIININSMFGHSVHIKNNLLSFYIPSKYAVTAMSEIFQTEIHAEKLDIKVTNLSPGLVKTEIAGTMQREDVYEIHPYILPEDISDAVLYVLSTPPNVVISELKIEPLNKATEQKRESKRH